MLPFNKRLIIKSILIIISLLYNASRNTGVYFIHRVNYNYNTNIKLSMIVPLFVENCRGRTRTYDFWDMNPMSYQLLYSAIKMGKMGFEPIRSYEPLFLRQSCLPVPALTHILLN